MNEPEQPDRPHEPSVEEGSPEPPSPTRPDLEESHEQHRGDTDHDEGRQGPVEGGAASEVASTSLDATPETSGAGPDLGDLTSGATPGADDDSASAAPFHVEHPTGDDPADAATSAGPVPPVRTAADLATTPSPGIADGTTPMARAVEAELRRRTGYRFGASLPRPGRTRVMVVGNQKGGVGKTTSTVNLAAALAQQGLRVLVIDLDPQGNASTALSVDHRRGTPSTYDVLVDGVPLADVVQQHDEVPNLEVVPATIDLAGAEIELVSMVARESRLRKALAAYDRIGAEGEDRLDYVLVDCPPSLGLLTLNALVAGAEMLIPIQAEYYALEGLGQLLETVEMVRAHLNTDLEVTTILITMYDSRTRLAAGVADEVREHFRERVLKTTIPRSVRVSEAPSYGQTVMTYDPGSPGALSYFDAAREIATKGATA